MQPPQDNHLKELYPGTSTKINRPLICKVQVTHLQSGTCIWVTGAASSWWLKKVAVTPRQNFQAYPLIQGQAYDYSVGLSREKGSLLWLFFNSHEEIKKWLCVSAGGSLFTSTHATSCVSHMWAVHHARATTIGKTAFCHSTFAFQKDFCLCYAF